MDKKPTIIAHEQLAWDRTGGPIVVLLSDGSEGKVTAVLGPGYWHRIIGSARQMGIDCCAADFGSTVPKIIDDEAVWDGHSWVSNHPLCVRA